MKEDNININYNISAVLLLGIPVVLSILKFFGYGFAPVEKIFPAEERLLVLIAGMIFGMLYFMMKYNRFQNESKIIIKCHDFPEISEKVRKLCNKMAIEEPEVGFLESSIPNAFVYKNHNRPVLVLTIPLIEILDDRELETVLAHELTHIKNKDMELRKYSLLLRFILFLNPLIHLIEPFVSRSREFLADETSARTTRAPRSLASALLKIEEYTSSYENIKSDHRFSLSVPPEVFFFEEGLHIPYIFSRTPSTEKRIKKLMSLNIK